MVFAGHDHHYERSYLIYKNKDVNQSTEIEFEDSLNGTIYYVTGGGGAPVYGLGPSKWWCDAGVRTTDNHYCLIDTDTPNKLEFVAKDRDGDIIDQVTITQNIAEIYSNNTKIEKHFDSHYSNSHIYLQIPENAGNKLVNITLYTIHGKRLLTLTNGILSAGTHLITLNKSNLHDIASGLLICRFESAGLKKSLNILWNN